MDTAVTNLHPGQLTDAELAQYRRQGYLVVPRLLSPALVRAALDAVAGLASGAVAAPRAKILMEPAVAAGEIATADRQDIVRKLADYVEDAPALMRVAMLGRLHAILDQLMGAGRVLFQEMALIKPPHIGSEKPWHQDAAYFRVSDPSLIVGVWVALDPASVENGCMEVIPASHLDGPVPHVPMADINVCHIRPDLVRIEERLALEMRPGDALLFHPYLHHYTRANRSPLRRRALQFHYHQLGLEWVSLEAHRRRYHDAEGAYAGCTVPKGAGEGFVDRGKLARAIVPMDDLV
jgi:phytanoyl-CoA hydroxylase